MKKARKIACVILSLIFALLAVTPGESYAGTALSSITSDSIKEKQKQIEEAEAKKKELQSSLTNAQSLLKELEGLKSDAEKYIQQIDAEIVAVEENIEYYEGLITEKEAEIVEITAELEEAERVEQEQYEAMKIRIKFMYEQGDTFYLELMFGATGFGDFLTRANYIEQLSAYDRKKMDEYTAQREWTELVKQTLEAEKEVLDATKADCEAEKASLDELMASKETELANYNSQITVKEGQISSFKEDIAAEEKLKEVLNDEILEEQKAIAAKKGLILTYDGGKFTWPCPSYVAITEEFGWRTNPIYGTSEFHRGIDLGAPYGSAILAAYDGVVVQAGYDNSMGNYVMINHGDGLITIYMHASKLLVSKDDVVFRGEKIAQVGSTGDSTGNHLHFGVRLNGTYVSPWNYFK